MPNQHRSTFLIAEERFHRIENERKARKRGEATDIRKARKEPPRRKRLREQDVWWELTGD